MSNREPEELPFIPTQGVTIAPNPARDQPTRILDTMIDLQVSLQPVTQHSYGLGVCVLLFASGGDSFLFPCLKILVTNGDTAQLFTVRSMYSGE